MLEDVRLTSCPISGLSPKNYGFRLCRNIPSKSSGPLNNMRRGRLPPFLQAMLVQPRFL